MKSKFSQCHWSRLGFLSLSNPRRTKTRLGALPSVWSTVSLFVSTGLISLIVYVITLAPTITWQHGGVDSGDFASAVAVGGVPHPPGYPTYIILGTLFQYIPFGDVAYRLNLLSAVSAALTVALTGLIVYRLLQTHLKPKLDSDQNALMWCCAFSASLLLAFAPLFWSQAVIAEVYTLNALFFALLLYGAIRSSSANEQWLVPLLSFGLAVGLGNHLSLLLVLPGLVVLMPVRWRLDLIPRVLLPFVAGLSIYATLYWRATTLPPVNWGMATSWPNFVWLVTAEAYRHFLFATPTELFAPRLASLVRILSQAFTGWGIPVGLAGLLFMVFHNRRLFFSLALPFLTVVGYAVTYNTTDAYVYLLPVLLIFSVAIGWGLFHLSSTYFPVARSTAFASGLVLTAIALLPLIPLLLNFSTQDLSDDHEAFHFAQSSLQVVQPNAVIVTNDDPRTFALWYVRYGNNLRPDVAIVNSNLLPYPWYRTTLQRTHSQLSHTDNYGQPLQTLSAFVETNHGANPIYLATPSKAALDEFRVEAAGKLYLVLSSHHQ